MSKKVLLTSLNSKYVHSNLALKYLYMAAEGCEGLEIREFTINNSRDYIFNELVMGDYDAVCFSCYIWNIEKTTELAADLKKAKPQVSILFGGPEVSYDSAQFMQDHPFLDFLIYGEGEAVFAAWCREFCGADMQSDEDCGCAAAGDYSGIPGLVWRAENRVDGVCKHAAAPGTCGCAIEPAAADGVADCGIIVNGPAAPVVFGESPFPYGAFSCETDKVIYYEASRGCPFNCSYCISSLDRRIRELPVERVKEDLAFFLSQNVKQVKFLDRTFNWDRKRSLELFSFLIDNDNGVTNFHFEVCADLLDDEIFDVLRGARHDLFQFEIGIQSTHGPTLAAVNRSTDVEKVKANVLRLLELGNAHIHVDLIAGLPYEDYATFRKSFNDVYGLGADNLQLGFLKLLKGTEIREKAGAYNYQYMDKAPYQVISNDFMTAQELCRLKQIEEVLDLYNNRGGFKASLAHAIEVTGKGAFDFYEDFSEYFYSKGYQHRSHKKEDLYRIFYGFAMEAGMGEEMVQLLEHDLEVTMNFDAVKKFKRKGWSIV